MAVGDEICTRNAYWTSGIKARGSDPDSLQYKGSLWEVSGQDGDGGPTPQRNCQFEAAIM